MEQHFIQASPIKDFAAFRVLREVLFFFGMGFISVLFLSSAYFLQRNDSAVLYCAIAGTDELPLAIFVMDSV
jgi:hypothetical protein